MIELVLHDSAEVVVEVVVFRRLARNQFVQAKIGESLYRFHEQVMSRLQLLDSLAPRRFAGIGHRRKILLAAQSVAPALGSAQNGSIPGGYMQNQLPDAVRLLDGMSRGGFGIHVGQNLQQRVAVPGISFEGTAELVSQTGGFGHTNLLKTLSFRGAQATRNL